MFTFFLTLTLAGFIVGIILSNCIIVCFTDKESLLRIFQRFLWHEKYLMYPLITLYFKVKGV